MKTKTYPIFHIDGRRARSLRKALGMPSDLKDLDEDTTTEITQIELALVAAMRVFVVEPAEIGIAHRTQPVVHID